MSMTTRTSYLDSIMMDDNGLTTNGKQQQKSPWYDPLYQYIQHLYMQFLLVTTLYIMEPWERMLVISILLFVISLVTYSAFIYIPFHIHHILQSTIPRLSAVSIP